MSAAVAGGDLAGVASAASQALGRPVAIAVPVLGEPVAWPRDAIDSAATQAFAAHAAAVVKGDDGPPPAGAGDVVPVRIGGEVVGIVAALPGPTPLGHDARAWLEAGATAAAVAALMRDAQEGGIDGSRRALLQALRHGPPADLAALAGHARRLGFDLSAGGVAVCAITAPQQRVPDAVPAPPGVLVAAVDERRICALVPTRSTAVEAGDPDAVARALAEELSGAGLSAAVSTARRTPEALHEALCEAELIAELTSEPAAVANGQEETYRLLIGVMLRDPDELERLRAQTILPIREYDAEHDTELLTTLRAFLAHDGSTTETADALQFHRHTVGYRLARVHEVSGLSPYESDGRERLSLGLKAHQILEVWARSRADGSG